MVNTLLSTSKCYSDIDQFILETRVTVIEQYSDLWKKYNKGDSFNQEGFEKEYTLLVHQLLKEIQDISIKLDIAIQYKFKPTKKLFQKVGVIVPINEKGICYKLQDIIVEIPQKLFLKMKESKQIDTPYIPDIITHCIKKMVETQEKLTPSVEDIEYIQSKMKALVKPIVQILSFLEEENQNGKEELRSKISFFKELTKSGAPRLIRAILFMKRFESGNMVSEFKMGFIHISVKQFFQELYDKCKRTFKETSQLLSIMLSLLVETYQLTKQYCTEDLMLLKKVNAARFAYANDPSDDTKQAYEDIVDALPTKNLTKMSMHLLTWKVNGETMTSFQGLLLSRYYGEYLRDEKNMEFEINFKNKVCKVNFKDMTCTYRKDVAPMKYNYNFKNTIPSFRVSTFLTEKTRKMLEKLLIMVEPLRDPKVLISKKLKDKSGVIFSAYSAIMVMDIMYNCRLMLALLQGQKVKKSDTFTKLFESYQEKIEASDDYLYEPLGDNLLIPYIYNHNPGTPDLRQTITIKLNDPEVSFHNYVEGLYEYHIDNMKETSELRTNTENLFQALLIETLDFKSYFTQFLNHDAVELCINVEKKIYIPVLIDKIKKV